MSLETGFVEAGFAFWELGAVWNWRAEHHREMQVDLLNFAG
jgi:hypothetical protein